MRHLASAPGQPRLRLQDPQQVPGDWFHPAGGDRGVQAQGGHPRGGKEDRGVQAGESRHFQLGDQGEVDPGMLFQSGTFVENAEYFRPNIRFEFWFTLASLPQILTMFCILCDM